MSFLNQVSEPVKRFKSTDAGAPQINYNARTAGDVKAVLKACLVDGYGAVESAGWTAVNEVANVIEFVSPSAAMSDYRLGVDDSSAATTTWFYQYLDARVNPTYRTPSKNFSTANKTHPNNGWQLLATDFGCYFLEHTAINASGDMGARLTYFGQVKSALSVADTRNISFWYAGWYGAQNTPNEFFESNNTFKHYVLAGRSGIYLSATNILAMRSPRIIWSNIASTIDLSSDIFLLSDAEVLGQQPGLLTLSMSNAADLLSVKEVNLNGRPVLIIPMVWEYSSDATQQKEYVKHVMLRLDSWEY